MKRRENRGRHDLYFASSELPGIENGIVASTYGVQTETIQAAAVPCVFKAAPQTKAFSTREGKFNSRILLFATAEREV